MMNYLVMSNYKIYLLLFSHFLLTTLIKRHDIEWWLEIKAHFKFDEWLGPNPPKSLR
jgi:hypothetical protein